MMSQGKNFSIDPSGEPPHGPHWPGEHVHSAERRRRRRGVSFRPRRQRQRIVRTALLCSVVLLAMAAGIYAALSQNERQSGSALPSSGALVLTA
jgi:hypothetical protein